MQNKCTIDLHKLPNKKNNNKSIKNQTKMLKMENTQTWKMHANKKAQKKIKINRSRSPKSIISGIQY